MIEAYMKGYDRLFPAFLMNDSNGLAIAKALLAGLERMTEIIQDGLDITLDVEKMPEWRLDEMAWEYSCLYDFTAPVEQKRAWIREAMPVYRLYGTPEAITNYLSTLSENVSVLENWEYGGDPYSFRVQLDGVPTPENTQWVKDTVETVKNVRSNFEAMQFTARSEQRLYMGLAAVAAKRSSMTMEPVQL